MWIFEKLFSFIFPTSCYLCHKQGESLCAHCVKNLSRSIQTTPAFIHTTYSYRDTRVKQCLHQIKYYHRKDLIVPLVQETCNDDLREFIGNTTNTLLVPIPMHIVRRWSRGYNHAFHIAQAYGNIFSLPVNTVLLTKIRTSPQQAKIKSRSEREKNVRSVFAVHNNSEIPYDTRIILIDDTTTTHATLREAKHVLEKAGYRDIRAITLAH